jgi:tetratricopeptide (TPR) repeat protein
MPFQRDSRGLHLWGDYHLLLAILFVLGVGGCTLAPNPVSHATPSPTDAATLIANGQLTVAAELLDQEAARQPDNPTPLLQLGELYLRQRLWLPAEDAFNRALVVAPSHPAATAGLAEVRLQQGDFEAAQSLWLEAISQNPDLHGVYTGLGRLAMTRLDFPAAREAFETQQARQPDPEALWYLAALNAPTDHTRANEQLLAIPADAPAGVLARRDYLLATLVPFTTDTPAAEVAQATGIALVQVGMWPPAIHALEQARRIPVTADPLFQAKTLAFLGHAYAQMGKPALDLFEQAQQQDPDSALPLYFYGIFLRRQGASRAAMDQFEQAILREPDNAAVYAEMALTRAEQGDYAAAETLYQAAVDVSDNSPEMRLLQLLFYAQRGYRVVEAGIPLGESLVEADQTNAEALDWLGWLYLLAGESEKAEESFRKALALNPELVSARYHLGRYLLLARQNEQAAIQLQRVVDSDLSGTYRKMALQALAEIEQPTGN